MSLIRSGRSFRPAMSFHCRPRWRRHCCNAGEIQAEAIPARYAPDPCRSSADGNLEANSAAIGGTSSAPRSPNSAMRGIGCDGRKIGPDLLGGRAGPVSGARILKRRIGDAGELAGEIRSCSLGPATPRCGMHARYEPSTATTAHGLTSGRTTRPNLPQFDDGRKVRQPCGGMSKLTPAMANSRQQSASNTLRSKNVFALTTTATASWSEPACGRRRRRGGAA